MYELEAAGLAVAADALALCVRLTPSCACMSVLTRTYPMTRRGGPAECVYCDENVVCWFTVPLALWLRSWVLIPTSVRRTVSASSSRRIRTLSDAMLPLRAQHFGQFFGVAFTVQKFDFAGIAAIVANHHKPRLVGKCGGRSDATDPEQQDSQHPQPQSVAR